MDDCVECNGDIESGGKPMLMPDLCSRMYTAEVLRIRGDTGAVAEAVASLTQEHRPEEQVGELEGNPTLILHCFIATTRIFHRASREVINSMGETVTVPRTKIIKGKQYYLYDMLFARCGHDAVVAVPYHGLAKVFFVQLDRTLAGKRVVYEKLDITKLVMSLGQAGQAEIPSGKLTRKLSVGLTHCHLSYLDPDHLSRNLEQVSMSGMNLGASDVYRYLVEPVLDPRSYPLSVTPILLGFALFADGIRKTSATTDRHGNFKLWIGPGATRIERLFSLLAGIESIEGIVSTTGNLPILQSRVIGGAEEG